MDGWIDGDVDGGEGRRIRPISYELSGIMIEIEKEKE